METLSEGTRIYNHGDRCNPSHFGEITLVKIDRWGIHYQITPDKGEYERDPYWIDSISFHSEFKGHGGTRFVTEEAYKTWREKRIAESNAAIAKALKKEGLSE
jgi:hypothetical protein